MRICLINNLYIPWERGGAERIVLYSANGLKKAGYEVFVISTAPEETKSENVYFLKSIFYNLGSYPFWQRLIWHIWDFFSPVHLKKIKKILELEKPDLVITHNLKGIGLLLPCFLKKKKIRHFHTLHDIQLLHPSGLMFWGKEKILESFPAKVYQNISRFLFGSPELVISPSQWLLSEHEKRNFFKESRKIVLPNFFKNNREVSYPEKSNNPFTFLTVGLLDKHKGTEFLLESFSDFLKKNPNVQAQLILAGDGKLMSELKNKYKEEKAIKIIGRQTKEEVRDLMLEADCFIMPSLCYENSPTVIYESVEVGLPVLASRLGGITELIEAAGGWLLEPGNQKELVEKMEHLISFPSELEAVRKKEKFFNPSDYLVGLQELVEGGDKNKK